MTFNTYKDGRGWYRLMVFDREGGLSVYKLKGKQAVRTKKKELSKLSESVPNRMHWHHPLKIMLDGKVILQYHEGQEAQRADALEYLKKSNRLRADDYVLETNDL